MNKNPLRRWDCLLSTESDGEKWRVVGFSGDLSADGELAIISLGSSRRMPKRLRRSFVELAMMGGKLAPVIEDLEPPSVLCEEDIPEFRREKFLTSMQQGLSLIRPIISMGWEAFIPICRNAKVRQIAGTSGSSVSWINDLLIAYWRSGGSQFSLGPNYSKCGSKPGLVALRQAVEANRPPPVCKRRGRSINHPVESEDAGIHRGGCSLPLESLPVVRLAVANYLKDSIKQAVVRISLKQHRGLPWNDIKLFVWSRLDSDPRFTGLRPTTRQVKWTGKDMGPTLEVLEHGLGMRYTAANIRPLNGDYRDFAWSAGAVYEIDPHVRDIELVEDGTLMPCGRGALILVVDRASTMITGFAGTAADPRFRNMGIALNCAFSNKPEWCRTYLEMEIGDDDWPCEGICDMISADNKELAGKAASLLPELIGDLGFARAYRGDDKPQVEITFALGNTGFVHHYGYGISKGPKARCEVAPRDDAQITLRTYLRGLVRWIIDDYNNRPFPKDRELHPDFIEHCRKSDRLLTPKEYWKWSIDRQRTPLAKYVPEIMYPRLLESALATVTVYGLELEGMVFDFPKDSIHEKNRSIARWIGAKKIRVHFDRISTNQVYIIDQKAGLAPMRCPLSHISRNFSNRTWEAVGQTGGIVGALQKKTERAHDEKRMKVRADTHSEAKEAHNDIVERYGSVKNRNDIARRIDIKATKQTAVNDENKKLISNTEPVAEPVSNTEVRRIRPKIYE
jgi:hypothetical protein